MKSINYMFLEGSPRIFANLNRVDLVERAGNSVVRQEVLRRALELIEVLLVPDLQRCAPLDPLHPVLLSCVPLVMDKERVHFRPQSNELGDRFTVCNVLEFANHFVVGRIEEWARLVERGEVEVLPLCE